MEEVPGLGLEWPDTEDMTGLPGTRGTEVREPPGVPSWPCSVWLAGAGGLGSACLWLRLDDPGRDLSRQLWVVDCLGCLEWRGREE